MFDNNDGGIFDYCLPDVSGDGKSDELDLFLLNEMINDIEDVEQEQKAQKKKLKNNNSNKLKNKQRRKNFSHKKTNKTKLNDEIYRH